VLEICASTVALGMMTLHVGMFLGNEWNKTDNVERALNIC